MRFRFERIMKILIDESATIKLSDRVMTTFSFKNDATYRIDPAVQIRSLRFVPILWRG